MATPLAIIAGNTQFPLLVAKKAREMGRKIVIAAHEGETDPLLAKLAPDFIWVKLGQLQKIMDFFHQHGAKEVLMAGGLTKEQVFVNYEPDERAINMLSGLSDFHDDKILRALAQEFENEGLKVCSAAEIIPEVLAPKGLLTKTPPAPEIIAEVEFGRKMALELGRLDVGQCVVVKNKIVLALEAIEGTDAAIRRGASHAKGEAVIVKMAKPTQDLRFDMPSVGLNTVKLMVELGARALAIEAGKTLMFDQEEMVALADRNNLVILGITSRGPIWAA